MIEIDKKRILDKLQVIQDTLSKLTILSELSEDEFIQDFRNYDSTKYNFEKIIEAIIEKYNKRVYSLKLDVLKY